MPQKKLDASDETVRITIRLTKRTCDQLDKIRDDNTRSEWIRVIIEESIRGQYNWIESLPTIEDEEPLPKATAPVPDARKSGGMISTPKPAKKLKIVPEKKHRHRFERGEIVGHQQRGAMQIPVYRYECGSPECDASEERP